MTIEREIKFLVNDFEPIRYRLKKIGAYFIDRYFERNIIFDYPDRRLRKRGYLLRLRIAGKKNILCLKHPRDKKEDGLKVMKEFETGVEDEENMVIILEKIGLEKSLIYEKIREKWEFENTIFCLDELPFGNCVEIEGRGDLKKMASKIGLDPQKALTISYHQLNAMIRKKMGLPSKDSFVFKDWREEKTYCKGVLDHDI